MQLYLVVSGVCNAGAAAYCAKRWLGQERKGEVGKLFGLFFVAIAGWSILYVCWQLSATAKQAQMFCALLLIPAAAIGPLFYHHVRVLVSRPLSRPAIIVIYGLVVLNAVVALCGGSVGSVEPLFDVRYWPRAGAGFWLFVFTYSMFILGCAYGFAVTRNARGYRAQTIRNHCMMGLAGAALGFCNLPGWWGAGYPPWSNLLIAPYTLGVSYSFQLLVPGKARSPNSFILQGFVALVLIALASSMTLLSIGALLLGVGTHLTASGWMMLFLYHVVIVGVCYMIIPRTLEFESRLWNLLYPESNIQRTLSRLEQVLATASPQNSGMLFARELSLVAKTHALALFLSSEDEQLALCGLVGCDAREVPAQLDMNSVLVTESLLHHRAISIGWLDVPTTDKWALAWHTAIPVIRNGAVTCLALVKADRQRGLKASAAWEMQVMLGRLESVLQTSRLARQVAQKESFLRLGYLATGIAHEVRNPLTSMKAYVELAHRGVLSGESEAELYRQVCAGMERMLGAIEAVSAYADDRRSKHADVKLREVVTQAAAMYAVDLRRASVRVANEIADGITVFGNRRELLQIFANLVSNATDAMSPLGGGQITVSAELLSSADTVRIRFADTGPGVPETVIARLGQPFVTTKTNKYEPGRKNGYGIGLSLVLDRIVAHGGNLTYQRPAFIFTLPVHELNHSQHAPSARDAG